MAATGIGDNQPAIETMFDVDLSKEGDRFKARDVLTALIASWIAAWPRSTIAQVVGQHGECWAAYQTFRQLPHEDWRVSDSNPTFRDVEQPGLGKLRIGGSPLHFWALEAKPPLPAPRRGEHTETILADDLGLNANEVGQRFDHGIVAGPDTVA